MNQQKWYNLTTPTIMLPLGVPPCMHVILMIGQTDGGMVLPWRTHHRGPEIRWCGLRPRWRLSRLRYGWL
jgi:hypothetical protein